MNVILVMHLGNWAKPYKTIDTASEQSRALSNNNRQKNKLKSIVLMYNEMESVNDIWYECATCKHTQYTLWLYYQWH